MVLETALAGGGGPVKTLKTWKSPDWWLAVAADDFHMSVKHCYNEQIAKVSQAQCQVASQIVPAECLRAQSVYSDLVKRQLVIIYLCFPLSKVHPVGFGSQNFCSYVGALWDMWPVPG